MKPRIAVAVSGGVDSLVAAHLLREKGFRIILLHFRTGFEREQPDESMAAGGPIPGIRDIGRQLGEPVHMIDVRAAFACEVVEYFTAAYCSGETPNPCVVCNPAIKFGPVLEAALDLGAEALATGHYARLQSTADGRVRLLRGCDPQKDQSYFLSRLSQPQLRRAVFPIGRLKKTETRAIAERCGLKPVTSTESQDACFVNGRSYKELLATARPEAFEPGPIEHVDGRLLGRHRGLAGFTVGQRRGIDCPAEAPYYVVRLDTARNRLIVAGKDALYSTSCRVRRIRWVAAPPGGPLAGIQTRLRYRHRAAASTFVPGGADEGVVLFDIPQKAVTPGQAAVFYDGDEVLGGGFIAAA